MKLYNKLLLIIAIILFSSCSKDLQITSVEGVKEHDLGLKDERYTKKLRLSNANYFGFKDHELKRIFKNYIDTVDLEDYSIDPAIEDYLVQEMEIFYKENDYSIAWSKGKSPTRDAQYLITTLNLSSEEGLDPNDYNSVNLLERQGEIYQKKKYVNIYDLLDLDLRFTAALITYAWHLENGRFDPGKNDWRWAFDIPTDPVAARLSVAVSKKQLKKELDEIKPDTKNYEALKEGLEQLRSIKYDGGWSSLPNDLRLEEGDTSRYVAMLRKRLIASGDHRSVWSKKRNDPYFDTKLKEALIKFQKRHGLVDDGILGNATTKMLNVNVDEKIRIVKLNLERLRWMPKEMPRDYIWINLPDYKLKVFEKNKVAWDMRVIIGKAVEHATPIFHDELEYLVLSPTWGVPQKIIHKEMMPKIKRDPGFLTRNGYRLYVAGNSGEVDPYSVDWNSKNIKVRVVQAPGPNNALGRVKFIMPNRFNIYLHDTPADYLFKQNERDFSHGCIRLEKPQEFANYLLRKSDKWPSKKIEEFMYKENPATVWLDQPLPVYLTYLTAFADENGVLNFRKDIYDHDNIQTKMLADE